MTEQTLGTVVSGGSIQHSAWNQMTEKIQSTTDGHRHDGTGSYGPLSVFSGATFTQISTGGLNTSGNVVIGGTVNVVGLATFDRATIASNLSGAGTFVMGSGLFAGPLTVNSAFVAGIISAPGNLSGSGIVSQLVAGSNITISGTSGVGVVAIGVAGTTVFAGANQSFGTLVFTSALGLNTFQVSAQTTLADLIAGNISGTGSLYVQSGFTANTGVFTANLSAGFLNVGSSINATLLNTSGIIAGNLSANGLNVSGTANLQAVNASAVNLNTLIVVGNVSAGSFVATSTGTFYGVLVTSNISGAGNLTLQSRLSVNDGVAIGNFSAGSLYAGSSIFLSLSSNTAVILNGQIGTLTNTSLFTNNITNTSVGDFRIWTTSGGRAYISLNAQPSGTQDVAVGAIQWQQIFDQLSATPPQIIWQMGSTGTFITAMTLLSSGLAVTNNLSAGTFNVSAGIAGNISTGTATLGSARTGTVTVTSSLILNTSFTNGSAGNFYMFQLSSGRTYFTENTANASAIPNISTTPMLMQYYDYSSQVFGWQVAPTSGVINTYMTLTPTALTLSTGIRYTIRTVTTSTNTSANDYLIMMNNSSDNQAVSLARAASSIGQVIKIYSQSGGGTVTIFATSADQIDFDNNKSAITLSNNSSVTLMGYNNSTWLITGH